MRWQKQEGSCGLADVGLAVIVGGRSRPMEARAPSSMESRARLKTGVAKYLPWGVAVAALVAAYLILRVIAGSMPPLMRRAEGVDEIIYLTGLDFPASATLVNSRLTGWPHASLAARLDIDRTDLETFMQSQRVRGKWKEDTSGFPSDFKGLDWWEPPVGSQDARTAYLRPPRRTREPPVQPLLVMDILVVAGDGDSAIVYIWAEGS